MATSASERSLRWREIIAALLVLIVYSVCLYTQPTNTFWSPDEGCKFLQTETIQWDGGVKYVLPYRGASLDPDTDFYIGHIWTRTATILYPLQRLDGTFRFHWPLSFSFLIRVPVAFFGAAGGFIFTMLAGWLVAVLSGVLAAEVDRKLAAPAILIVGLSSPIWFFSLCFWEHTTSVVFALLAVLILMRRRGDLRGLLLSMPFVALAVMMRIELMALVAALCATFLVLLSFRPSRNAGAAERTRRMSLPVALSLAVLVIVTLVAVGLTLSGRHEVMLRRLPTRFHQIAHLPTVFATLLAAPHWTGAKMEARTGLLAVLCCMIAPFLPRRWLQASFTIAGLAVFAAYTGDLVFSRDRFRAMHGLFPVAPFMILAIHGARYAWTRRDSPFFVLAAISLTYFFLGVVGLAMIYADESGRMILGLAWGQRYLLTLYPLLIILSLAGVDAFWRADHRRPVKVVVVGLAAVLVLIGVRFELRGIDEARGTRRSLAAWQEAMENSGPIITDIWWLPAGIAEFYGREMAFAVPRRRKVADWVKEVSKKGVSSFTFASMDRVSPRDFGNPPPRNLVRRQVRMVRGLYLTKFSFLATNRRGFGRRNVDSRPDLASPPIAK